MKARFLPEHMYRSHLQRKECKCDSLHYMINYQDEHVMHGVYNWLHNITHTFIVFFFPRLLGTLLLFLHMFFFFLSVRCRMLEYSLNLENVSFSAVRTVRVLRPLRAINRVPSEFKPADPSHLSPPTPQHLGIKALWPIRKKNTRLVWNESQAIKDPHTAQLLGFTLSEFGVKVFLGLSYFGQ